MYLLNYGWPDGEWEQIFKRHFMKLADMASETAAVVISSKRGVHFGNEVLNYYRVGSLDADKVLPGLLITKTPPEYFTESQHPEDPAEPGLGDLLVIPLQSFCTDEVSFISAMEKIFSDLKDGTELRDFEIAEHDISQRRRLSTLAKLVSSVELKPGAFGFSVDVKKLLSRDSS
jgi:hypothetical protein